MKSLICALNTKYVHSSLAPWCLKAGVYEYAKNTECRVLEATINESTDSILEKILGCEFDIIGFCTYIWNVEKVLSLCKMVSEKRENATIVLGGPEVSYRAKDILEENPCVSLVISGEGEEPFGRLCNDENPEEISGVSYRKDGQIVTKTEHVSKKQPPSPYTKEYFEGLNGRISYIETSRGCPFSCAFCLSGRCGNVRFFDVDEAKENIIKLSNSGTKTVKFVDRTFNADKKRANEIFNFIIDNYGTKIPEGVCFHFELEGEIIDDETIFVLSKAPAGAIQVEIGLQSFNVKTLEAINRKTKIERLYSNISKIVSLGNIHTHIDLIAGLPYEDIDSFENSFNRALSLEPHMLQLGFLKLLYGSELREKSDYVYEFSENPPYEVISTPHISREELFLLHKIEDVFERLYNSMRFPNTVKYLHSIFDNQFKMYKSLALCLENKKNIRTLDDFTYAVYEFFSSDSRVNKAVLRDCLAKDRLSTNKMGALPEFLKFHSPMLKKALNSLEKSEDTRKSKGVKRAATLLISSNELIYVDYENINPVTRSYPIRKIKIEGIF